MFICHQRAPGTALMPHTLLGYMALHIYTPHFTTFKVSWDFSMALLLHFILKKKKNVISCHFGMRCYHFVKIKKKLSAMFLFVTFVIYVKFLLLSKTKS